MTSALLPQTLALAWLALAVVLEVLGSCLLKLSDGMRRRLPGLAGLALVIGAWPAARKVVDVALHKYLDAQGERRVRIAGGEGDEEGKRSITLVKVVQHFQDFSLLDVTIKTGRTHQIRVHLASRGHPLVGDVLYGGRPLLGLSRQALHAAELAFAHPADGRPMAFAAPLPPDMAQAIRFVHAHDQRSDRLVRDGGGDIPPDHQLLAGRAFRFHPFSPSA